MKELVKLEKQFDRLANIDIRPAGRKSISLVQEDAKSGCPVNDGELRGSIYTHEDNKQDKTVWDCYTNKKHGPFVEFGTGPKGQAHHEGISPDVDVAYSQSPWWIHESQIDKAVAEKYHFFKIETKDGIFYQCTGQAAQPYMYPALKNNEDAITNIFAEHIKKQIGDITK